MVTNIPGAVILWMFGAIASFTLMAVGGRELSAELDTFGILFVRSLVGLFVVLIMLARSGWRFAGTQRFGQHLIRNLVHFGGQFGWFFALALLPLAQVFALEFTTPLWAIVLAVLVLRERITTRRVLALILGFIGVMIILRPGVIPISVGVAAALGSAVCYAVSLVMTKRMIKTEAPVTILFYMTVIQLPIALVAAWPNLVMPSINLWPWVVAVGLSALGAHYCLARAFTVSDASVVLPIDFLRLPVIALVGAAVYGESVEIFLFLGAALMVIGNMISLTAERKPA